MASPTQKRNELQDKLEAFLGSSNVYFQKPTSGQMKYPCIIYSLSKIDLNKADNKIYKADSRYTVILVHKNPDNDLKDTILNAFDYISMDRFYVSDNLNHYVYTLYY